MAFANTVNLRIETNPASQLFVVDNIAPGDSISRTIRVKNSGDIPFTYTVSARMEEGSEALFNVLKIKLEQGDTVLTEGNLSHLSSYTLGELGINSFEEYTFSVHFPSDAGNEFQGLFTKVAFDFVAIAKELPPTDPPVVDPPTGDPDPVDPPPSDEPPIDKPDTEVEEEVPEGSADEEQPLDNDDSMDLEEQEESSLPSTNDEEVRDENAINALDQDESKMNGIELPTTSSPWYNILFLSAIVATGSIALIGVTIKIIRSK